MFPVPTVLLEAASHRVWFRQDDTFHLPKVRELKLDCYVFVAMRVVIFIVGVATGIHERCIGYSRGAGF